VIFRKLSSKSFLSRDEKNVSKKELKIGEFLVCENLFLRSLPFIRARTDSAHRRAHI